MVGMNYKDDRQKAISWLKELGNPYALSLFDGDGMLGWISVSMARQKRSLLTATASFAIAMRAISTRVWEEEIKPLWEKYSKEAAQ